MSRKSVCGVLLGLWLVGLGGCSSGGGTAPVPDPGGLPSADVKATARGVPAFLSVASGSGSIAVETASSGDDVMLILASRNEGLGTGQVKLNGGGSTLALLPASRATGTRRHIAQAADFLPFGPATTAPASRQALGSKRTFSVVYGSPPTITATLQRSGQHGLIYVDDETPADAFTAADLDDLLDQFDSSIHPLDTQYYGNPADVDNNGKVTLVMTPRINPHGFGYFSSGDLHGTNPVDAIFCRVPLPNQGETYSVMRQALLATVIHEFQHLINFSQKTYLPERSYDEESWLNEAMSFLAEDLQGYHDTAGGSPENVSFYFKSPERYTLFELSGSYEDGHAGEGYLLLRYLTDQYGSAFLKQLAPSAQVGAANLASTLGRPFEELYQNFAAAVFLDETGLSSNGLYQIPGLQTRNATYLNGAVQLNGPAYTSVNASNGRPAATVSLTRGALRFLRLKQVPSPGVWVKVDAGTSEKLTVIAIRIPSTLQP